MDVAQFGIGESGGFDGAIGVADELAVLVVFEGFVFAEGIGNGIGQPLGIVMVAGGVDDLGNEGVNGVSSHENWKKLSEELFSGRLLLIN
ncbi:MAG: hypothetical protein Q4A74_09845 [Cardiobacteriaceae bacterium]|nr:hypothetical protein [Cardiobacteriaceae bacterium]